MSLLLFSDLPPELIDGLGGEVRAQALADHFVALLEQELGRSLAETNYKEFFLGDGTQFVWLDKRPVVNILKVEVFSEDWPIDTFGSSSSAEPKTAYRDPCWDQEGKLFAPYCWPVPKKYFKDCTGHWRSSSRKNIFIHYVSGFSALPGHLKYLLVADIERSLSLQDWRIKEERSPGAWSVKLRDSFKGELFSPQTLAAFKKYKARIVCL